MDSSDESDVIEGNGLLRNFDLRFDVIEDLEKVKKFFREQFTEWVFQEEEGNETHRRHYQCRGKTISKIRAATLANKLRNALEYGGSLYCQPTSTANRGVYTYVSKEHTRMAGPWSYLDVQLPPRYNKQAFPFQDKIYQSIETEKDERTIHVIIDEVGNLGKSWISGKMEVEGKAHRLRSCLSATQIGGMAYQEWQDPYYGGGQSKGFVVDIPRAARKNYGEIFAALEEIKEGILKDWRHGDRPKKVCWHQPVLWVFMNEKPDETLLTGDRWKFYKVNMETKDFE